MDNHTVASKMITIPQLLKLIQEIKQLPVVVCGSCGAIEVYVSEDKTECPKCDN